MLRKLRAFRAWQGIPAAFVGGDDKLVHIVNLANGASLGSLGDSSNPNGTFDGYVRAPVAGMDGRVYVLVHGHVNEATGANGKRALITGLIKATSRFGGQ